MLDGTKRRLSSVYVYLYTEDKQRLAPSNIFINTTYCKLKLQTDRYR